MATRRRFVMDKIRVRCPNHAVTPLRQAQAKVDVVESDTKIYLIESAHFLKDRLPQHQTSAGHRRAILLEHGAIEIARMPARNMRECVTSHASEAENNTAVLQ